MQKENLTYEWNDVALLADQRAYTILCKTMLQIGRQGIYEIQDVCLLDWTWQSDPLRTDAPNQNMVPFHGNVTLQITCLQQTMQRQTFFVDVPIQGEWQESTIQQNQMQLLFSHSQIVEDHLLLETVLQISRNQPLERSQVLLSQFQMEEVILLEEPWPSCDTLLTTSVQLQITDYMIQMQQLQIYGTYQIVCVYQSTEQSGEQVFAYEYCLPAKEIVSIPEGLKELDGIMSYFQSITAQVLDMRQIALVGSGVFCTLPVVLEEALLGDIEPVSVVVTPMTKEVNPSVVNKRGSRRETLAKYMRDLNNSVETPTSIRNFEIGTEIVHND